MLMTHEFRYPALCQKKKNQAYKEIEETTVQYKEQQKYSVQSSIYIITGQVWLLPRPSCWAQALNGREDASGELH